MEDGRVRAVPHDLFKVKNWRAHSKRELVGKEFPERAKGKYKVVIKGFEGKDEFRTLEKIIEGHHSTGSFWERLWTGADRLSTIAARFRLEYDYWFLGQADPFFVRVYGDIKEWNSKERESLHKRLMDILAQHANSASEEQVKAFEEVNELLKEFPADSRFPFTSLKTHHWLTHAICYNRNFWLRIKDKKEFENIYIIRISIAEPEFHKLKELRSFRELCSKVLKIAGQELRAWFPLQIGDDLYLVCVSCAEVDEVLHILAGIGFGFDADVFEWTIKREKKAVKADGSRETIYVVKGSDLTLHSIGVYEGYEYAPEKIAEYAKILEGEWDYVAWVIIKPRGDMKQIAKEFLEYGRQMLEKKYGEKRKPLEEPIYEPDELLSPELALSIAEGYNEFLTDCAKAIGAEGGRAHTVVRSFNETIFVSGLTEPPDAFRIYVTLSDMKTKLHMPALLAVVMAKPKYPFWRILELSEKSADADHLIFIVGEKMVKLTDKDVRLLREVVPTIKSVSRGQFSDIVTTSRRAGLEELKFMIEGKAANGRIPWSASNKLCWVIERFAEKYEGEKLRDVIYRGMKMLEPFTRRERR